MVWKVVGQQLEKKDDYGQRQRGKLNILEYVGLAVSTKSSGLHVVS